MVSCLMFKSLSHLGFIFVYGERLCLGFIDLYVVVQLSHYLFRSETCEPLEFFSFTPHLSSTNQCY